MAKLTELEQHLLDALQAAKEHLDYCGYGDSWERECAEAQGLEAKIDAAIGAAEQIEPFSTRALKLSSKGFIKRSRRALKDMGGR
jgi:hypothetical protein